MKAKGYISKKICELAMQFPNIRAAYEYDHNSDTHIIEVVPLDIYSNDPEYHEVETDIALEFDELYSPSSILFVSEESLNRVSNPEVDLSGWMYDSELEITSDIPYNYNVGNGSYNTQEGYNYSFAA